MSGLHVNNLDIDKNHAEVITAFMVSTSSSYKPTLLSWEKYGEGQNMIQASGEHVTISFNG